MSPETALYNFFNTRALAAVSPSPLAGLSVLPTDYSHKTDFCLVIGNCNSVFSPGPGGETKEYNGRILLQILKKVSDDVESAEYVEAREKVRHASLEVAGLLFDFSTLDGNVCDVQVEDGFRDYAEVKGNYYAIAIIPVIVNPL
ncbi:MAG TPA: hypothetical protein PKY82_02015 [Pyrinomonadaceae bacterium]|nr:hypothetical protein [Pyrinomonadaceae bacterium]